MKRTERIQSLIRRRASRINTTSGYRLDMAERLCDFPEMFLKQFLTSLEPEDISVYPKTSLESELKVKLSKINSVNEDNIFLENGSDTVIKNIIHALTNPGDQILVSQSAFPMYRIYAEMFEVDTVEVLFKQSKTFDIDDIFNRISDKTKLIFLANPNSPYGDSKSKENIIELLELLKNKDIYLIIDEAYIDFLGKSMCELVNLHDRIIFTRTFSKAWGAAGMRLGYGIASTGLVSNISKVSVTYPVSNITLKFGIYICENIDVIEAYSKNTRAERDQLIKALRLKGYDVLESDNNSLHIHSKSGDNEFIPSVLNKHKVSFKTGSTASTPLEVPGDKRNNWVRISVGEGIMEMPYIREILSS